jgi:O-antigen/teichoic acid export membrane protein
VFKKIISTIFARTLLAALNFILAIVTTQYLGPAGKGDVSLFVLNITIVQLVNNFVGGPYLVYLVPRYNFMHLLFSSYTWALFSSIMIPGILLLLDLQGIDSLFHLIVISFLLSLMSIHLFALTGKEEINKYNLTSLFQVAILLVSFVIYLEIFKERSVISYIKAMYISVVASLILSFLFIGRYFEKPSFVKIGETFYDAIKKGLLLQTGAIAQMLNYRLSFYLLDKLYEEGRKEVGIYSVTIAVAEALWLISQSVSLVLYSRISNTNDIIYSRKLTVALVKSVVVITILCMGILLCLPSSLFVFVFGNGFGEAPVVLFPLSAGIIIFSAGIVLSAYFVGIGKAQVSVVASVIGLMVTIICGLSLIPKYGMFGAAITASASYTAGVIYQFVMFLREAKEIQTRDFILSTNDILMLIAEVKKFVTVHQSRDKIKYTYAV